jgi:hypothetical protein
VPDRSSKLGKSAGNRGKGRRKGSRNKLTKKAKEAFQHAFDACGGVANLTSWARANPGEFYKLYARLIPTEQRIAGAEGEPLTIKVVFVDSSDQPLSRDSRA